MKTSSSQVLYLSYDGLTDPLGQSQILPYLAGLSTLGYVITVISFEKPERLHTSAQMIRQYCNENNLLWEPIIYHRNPPVLSTLYDLIALRRKARKLNHERDFSIVHCRSYITALIGLWLKNKYGVRFIFDMRGFWADERVEGGLWNLQNPLYKAIYNYFKKKEKQFLAQADHVISLTENARQEILSWGLKTVPISVIPTCVDLELFNPGRIIKQDQEILRTELGINQNDFILLYLGSWGTWYLTNEMLSFFTETKKRYPNTKLLIVSTDNIDLASYHLRHDVVVTRATRPRIPLYISIAQAAICFIKPTFSKKASSATKLGEILAMNIPVIVNKGWGDIDELIINLKSKVLFINLDVHDHYSIIESNEFFTDHYSLSGGIKKYHTIYSKLLTDHEQF